MKVFSKIPRTIKAVGVVSFLLNTSTLMVFSLFGLYLHDKLKIDFSMIGFLDGAVESFSFIMKIFSGVMSDIFMNRKFLFLIGAGLLFVAKPLEAIATSYWPLFQAKILERLGNGLQSTPRDAIVGDWAPKEIKATCFGFRQSFGALGSVVGAILAAVLLKTSGENYQFVFWMAAIPSCLAVLVIIFFIKDKKAKVVKTAPSEKNKYRKITFSDIKSLGPRYWVLIGVAATYMISKVTESIVILYVVSKLGLPGYLAPIVMICYQVANTFISLPAGMISDKIKSRENVFIVGIIIFILSDILFIFGTNMITMIIALIFLGGYIGISQSIFPAKIIDIVPGDLKGTAIGIFNLVCAISFLVGGSIVGHIADNYSLQTSFIVSSLLATFSLIVLFASKKVNKKLEKTLKSRDF